MEQFFNMRTEIAKNLVIANKYSNHDYNNQGEESVLQQVREKCCVEKGNLKRIPEPLFTASFLTYDRVSRKFGSANKAIY